MKKKTIFLKDFKGLKAIFSFGFQLVLKCV